MSAGHPRGSTLIELAVVLGIVALLLALVVPSYALLRTSVALANSSRELQSTLRLAQNRAVTSQGGTAHGVHLESGYYVLFAGSWAAPVSQTRVDFPHGVSVATGAGQTVTFSHLNGLPGAAQDIVLSAGSSQRTVRVSAGGLVSLP